LLPAQASAIPFEFDHIIARKHGGPSDLRKQKGDAAH